MTRRFDWGRLRLGCAWLLGTFLTLDSAVAQNVPPRKYAVQASAQVQESPPRIVLTWPNEGDANQYWVSRRTLDSGWQILANLGGGETSFADGNVSVGVKYEYQIVKGASGYTGYGYLSSGMRIPVVDFRGKIIVLVENSLAGALNEELNRLQSDLIGDGWVVIRRNASADDSPQSVKDAIRGIYDSDPGNVKALFLVGHLPVPYSGSLFPDGHPNHQGAWPADSYYADLDGNWTDSAVNNTLAEREANWNVPGDGKFDQSDIPSSVELMVGRVDLSNMTCYANKANSRSELDLMRQYLNKDHAFRFGEIAADRRGLICDNFADKGADPISGSAWRNFSGFFGANNVTEVGWDGYLAAATQNSYLWSYGSGGGSYYYCTGVATSDDLALNDVHAIFTMWMGSYFGDWNNESNFLRATLGSGTVLTASYSGFPHTMYFPMALGEPIGYAIQITQNNAPNTLYPPWNTGSGQVHIGLLGDPTLRMHPFRTASNLSANGSSSGVQLTWSPSPDGPLGYHVYRASAPEGPYTRITSGPIQSTSFSDAAPAGSYSYMVRAVRLEQSPSGTYFNLSEGIFAGASSSGGGQPNPPPPPPDPPATPTLQAKATAFNRVNLQWSDPGNESGFKLERKTANSGWTQISALTANTTAFTDTGVLGATDYSYRMRAFNDGGLSGYSSEVHVTTPASPQPQAAIHFIQSDPNTSGNWPSQFGTDGYAIPGKPSTLGGFAAPGSTWTWSDNTTDSRAPLDFSGASNRIASAWYGDSVSCTLSLPQSERVALYFVDWDRAGRVETLTIADAATGTALDSRDISNFGQGLYCIYELAGQVTIRITKKAGANAVLSGIFAGSSQTNPVTNHPLQLEVRMSAEEPILRVTGDAGQPFKIFRSSDFVNWSEVSSSALQDGVVEVPIPIDKTQRQQFFRTMNSAN
jgi:hypothetical protein